MRPALFWNVVSLEARTRMSYRADFWINAIVGFLVELGIVWYLWAAMFRESGRSAIGGFDFHGMIVYYLAVILLGKFVRTNRFEGTVATDIYEGDLNRYLLFPAPYFPFKYAQHLGSLVTALVQFALFGAVTTVFLELPPEITPTLATAARALVCVALANLLYYFLDFAVQLVAFWADNVWSLDVAKWFLASILGGFMLPLTVFPEPAQRVLEVLPFRFFFDFPARVLLGRIGPWEWAAGLSVCALWCVLFALLAGWIWRRGTRQYTGVGI